MINNETKMESSMEMIYDLLSNIQTTIYNSISLEDKEKAFKLLEKLEYNLTWARMDLGMTMDGEPQSNGKTYWEGAEYRMKEPLEWIEEITKESKEIWDEEQK